MSRENVELVQRLIDAFNRGDVNAAFAFTSEDLEMDLSASRGPLRGIYRGRDQTRPLANSFLQAWASVRWRAEEVTELEGDRVMTVSVFRMRGHSSGAEVRAKGASIWTIRDGEVATMKLYQSRADALEASGRSE